MTRLEKDFMDVHNISLEEAKRFIRFSKNHEYCSKFILSNQEVKV